MTIPIHQTSPILAPVRDEPQSVQWIDGVTVRSGLHIPYDRGVLTEMFRPEWDSSGAPIEHIHQVRMFPRTISAWHLHTHTVDRLFVNLGHMRVVLYDDRDGSPTRGLVNEIFASDVKPSLVVIPSNIWHGIENTGSGEGLYLNFASHAYNYTQPDHLRLPATTPAIPFDWFSGDITTVRR